MAVSSLLVLTSVIFGLSHATTQSADAQSSKQAVGEVITRLERLLSDVTNLKGSIDQLDSYIQSSVPPDDCTNGLDERCRYQQIQEQLKWKNILNGSNSPGKRSVKQEAVLHNRRKRSVDDLYRKRYLLQKIRDVLLKAESIIKEERKRSCNLNLGFHCQTDEYSSIADMYDFLASDMSPGKRKRAAQPSFGKS